MSLLLPMQKEDRWPDFTPPLRRDYRAVTVADFCTAALTNWLIPSLIEKMIRGDRPQTTSGRQLADYLFIDDVGQAVLSVAEHAAAQGIFNLGSGRPVSVRTIVETIRNIIAPDMNLVFGEVPHSANQVWHMEADITRLTSLTGFSPSVSIDEGLRLTADWHKARLP
ncbi:hypothetical protein GAO09_11440 [Rhizobiales bacterium RZME27]|uniref:Uncharacterized protein n=1 Tax=Endobacterium cereale TaxID=2663029 RepID=A0A6A8A5L9_9HYPH|nr:hypothetical protein [Endobacterium cereale]MQY46652.1 hypothetical protein [Endobacterium cereale]